MTIPSLALIVGTFLLSLAPARAEAPTKSLRERLLQETRPAIFRKAWTLAEESKQSDAITYVVLKALADNREMPEGTKRAFFETLFASDQAASLGHLLNFLRLHVGDPSAPALARIVDTQANLRRMTTAIRASGKAFILGRLVEDWFRTIETRDPKLRLRAMTYMHAVNQTADWERVSVEEDPHFLEEEWERVRTRLDLRFALLDGVVKSQVLSEGARRTFLEKALWSLNGRSNVDLLYYLRFRRNGSLAGALSRLLDSPANVRRMSLAFGGAGTFFLAGTLADLWVATGKVEPMPGNRPPSGVVAALKPSATKLPAKESFPARIRRAFRIRGR